MKNAAQTRILAVALAIATLAACVLALMNLERENGFEVPTDGVSWVETTGGLLARHVPSGSPGDRAGIRAGDGSEECVAICRSKGLSAERAELFEHLDGLPDLSLGGVYCSQVVEHLPPERLPDLIQLLAKKLGHGALLAIETPNPECLAIFATHFFLDPTHTRPIPPPLLRFYLEEAGLVNVEIERLTPAIESMPSLAELPASFREAFFGGLDYAIFGRRL